MSKALQMSIMCQAVAGLTDKDSTVALRFGHSEEQNRHQYS